MRGKVKNVMQPTVNIGSGLHTWTLKILLDNVMHGGRECEIGKLGKEDKRGWQNQQGSDTSRISGMIKQRCSEIQRQKSFEKFLLVFYQDMKQK
jgi:hypothetical protein